MNNGMLQQTSGSRTDVLERAHGVRSPNRGGPPSVFNRMWTGVAGRYGLAIGAVVVATAVRWWAGGSGDAALGAGGGLLVPRATGCRRRGLRGQHMTIRAEPKRSTGLA